MWNVSKWFGVKRREEPKIAPGGSCFDPGPATPDCTVPRQQQQCEEKPARTGPCSLDYEIEPADIFALTRLIVFPAIRSALSTYKHGMFCCRDEDIPWTNKTFKKLVPESTSAAY